MKKLVLTAVSIGLLAGVVALTTSQISAEAKPMREVLPLPPTVFDANGKKIPTESLRGKIVALYFSAHWCGPCRQFTPKLVEFRDQNAKDGFEVVFMSLDRSAKAKADYMKAEGMKWLNAPGQSTREINHIMNYYKLRGIPSLIVFGPNGELITTDGRGDVTGSPSSALKKWKSQLGS